MSEAVTYVPDDHQVGEIRIDDGRVNALSHDLIDAIHGSLDRAEGEARAVMILGRPGKFCAGFDLSVMQEGPEAARALVQRGGELALRIYDFPLPVVMGCTGHALAMGAILLMSADLRIGTEGDFKIGMNEVSIGMPVPTFATALARERLSPRHATRATLLATVYSPADALDAGFLDEVATPVDMIELCRHRARALAAEIQPAALARTRTNLRGEHARAMRDGMEADLADFVVTPPA